MSRLGNISGKEAAKAFGNAGWMNVGQVGSHITMSKPGVRLNLTIPQHKELAKGLLRSLIAKAGLTIDQFLELL